MDETNKQEPKKEFKAIVRILNTDILGEKSIYNGLRKIKGISFMFANAICNHLNINKNKKIGELTSQEITKIETLVNQPKDMPHWLLNRRKDMDTGEDIHVTSTNLRLTKDNDLKKLKKLKSYKGMRHAWALPVRGQRTRGHFRKGGKVGVVKKKVVQAKKPKK